MRNVLARCTLGVKGNYDDYKDDAGFVYKIAIQGPAFGFVFPF